MWRFEIINRLIDKRFNDNCNYLEIGVSNPSLCFDVINSKNKTGVDPGNEYLDNPVEFKMTSDEFFRKLRLGETRFSPDYKWDIIFIDGLHLAHQVFADAVNVFQHIQPNGFIILHDCNPPTVFNCHSVNNLR